MKPWLISPGMTPSWRSNKSACLRAKPCRARPGHLEYGRGSPTAGRRGRGAAARARSRHDADRHRRDVRRRRRRGGRRRGHRRPARRGVPGQQGLPSNASRTAHDRRLRGSLKRLGTDRHRSLSAALARHHALEDTLDGFRALQRPARSGTGASATSTSATWRSCSLPAARRSPPTRCSTILTRRGIEYDLCRGRPQHGCRHGLFADRAGPACSAHAALRRSRRRIGRRRRRSRWPSCWRGPG